MHTLLPGHRAEWLQGGWAVGSIRTGLGGDSFKHGWCVHSLIAVDLIIGRLACSWTASLQSLQTVRIGWAVFIVQTLYARRRHAVRTFCIQAGTCSKGVCTCTICPAHAQFALHMHISVQMVCTCTRPPGARARVHSLGLCA